MWIERVLLFLFSSLLQILFQLVLIMSGNLSFLNWLTIAPALCCFDDAFIVSCMETVTWANEGVRRKWDEKLQMIYARSESVQRKRKNNFSLAVHSLLAMVLIAFSFKVVVNLASQEQIMNTSFDSLNLVNTYGAFGTITRDRNEIVIEGTLDNPNDPAASWQEFEFKCKPGKVERRPCWLSPYHYRLDWLMWFAPNGELRQNPWLVHLLYKLLQNSEEVKSLLAPSPFDKAPKAVRAKLFTYAFAKNQEDNKEKAWWERRYSRDYSPILTLDNESLLRYLSDYGFIKAKQEERVTIGNIKVRGSLRLRKNKTYNTKTNKPKVTSHLIPY